jgi:DNA recombination protein RmuC
MIAAVIILGVAVAVLAVLLLRAQKPAEDSGTAMMLKQDLTTLTESVHLLKDSLQTQLNTSLDKSNRQIISQFKESASIIKDVTQKLTNLERTNQQVGDIAGELKTLQNVLSNPKQRGVLGEFYLDQILQNLLPPGSYELQHKLGEGLIVDAVIKLDGRLLPIDSKFSLENYNRLIDAKGDARTALERQFKEDLKKRIDETS